MDGTNFLAMLPQGQGAPAPIGGNQDNSTLAGLGFPPPAPESIISGNAAPAVGAPGVSSGDAANGLGNLGGMAAANHMGMLGNAGMGGIGGLNHLPNDLMNAFLMNNALQQQVQQPQQLPQQPPQAQDPMMNPLILQSMMNQGMMGNPLNNLLQQGMMNPTAGIIGSGMGLGLGMPGLNGVSGAPDSSGPTPVPGFNGADSSAAPAPVISHDPAPAPPAAKAPGPSDNSNDILTQLMQNPMAAQMMAQGLNPMALLGGGLGQSLPGGGNPLGAALGLGAAGGGLGAGLPPTFSSGFPDAQALSAGLGLGLSSLPNPAVPGAAGAGASGAPAPHPNALFAFAVPPSAQNVLSQALPKADADGSLEQPIAAAASRAKGAKPKKPGKKTRTPGKPKRPLSAYNFFFREERARILDSIPQAEGKKKKKKRKDGKVKEEDNGKAGEKEYDQVGDDGKKIPHGKIGFENLAKLIGKRWQELDAEGMEKYKKLADDDMTRYKREMEAFMTREARAGMTIPDGDLMSNPVGEASAGFYGLTNEKRKGEDDDAGGMHPKKKRSKKSALAKAKVEL